MKLRGWDGTRGGREGWLTLGGPLAKMQVRNREGIERVAIHWLGIKNGPLAQVVEQLAFNQRVAGSSPARLTNIFNRCGQPVRCPFLFCVPVVCRSCETA